MRLPYLQVDERFYRHTARVLGVTLRVGRWDALGLVMLLWDATLANLNTDTEDSHAATLSASHYTGGHEAAAAQIAAACEWQGDAAALVAALSHEHVRVLERTGDGFRVRGLDRYADAVDKSSNRRAWDAARKTLPKAGWTQTKEKAWQSPAGDVFVDPAKALEAWKANRERHDVRAKLPKAKPPASAPPAPVTPPVPTTPPAAPPAPNAVASPGHLFPEAAPSAAPAKRARTPKPAAVATVEAPPPSAYTATRDALCSVWEGLRGVKYEFDKRFDGKALNWIVWGSDTPTPAQKQGAPVRSPEDAARVFRVALTWPKSFPSCGGIRDLRNHWNTYAAGPTAAPSGFPGQTPDVRKGSVRPESQKHAAGTHEVQL